LIFADNLNIEYRDVENKGNLGHRDSFKPNIYMAQTGDFISLKEAASISGYSADYIGQLIRKGKLPGKQVYSHVAWVTTRDALLDYARGETSESRVQIVPTTPDFGSRVLAFEQSRAFKVIAYGAIGLSILCGIACFYLFSVLLEARLRSLALERAQAEGKMQTAQVQSFSTAE
jgi:hypothetical protein